MSKFSGRINRLQRASERVVSKFLSTERKLAQQNEMLTEQITELTDEMLLIGELREVAIKRRAMNAGIAQRIGQIVRGDVL